MTDTATSELLKKKSKKKAPAAPAELSVFDTIAQELQGIEQEKANAELDAILQSAVVNDFKLGGLLAQYQVHSDWWEGYASFKEFVHAKVDIHYRKALYLIRIYGCLLDNNISWDVVKDIGWTRLKDLTVVLTADNVNEWVAKAKVLSTLQLQEAIKEYLKQKDSGEEDPGVTSTVSTMTFKLHEDQREQVRMALDKAKAELQTEFDTVALEGICTGYLGGSVEIKAVNISLVDLFSKVSYEEVLEAFEQVWPDVNLTLDTEEADAA